MTSIRQHPLITFFVLAFGLTWLVWVPRALGLSVGVLDPISTYLVAMSAVLAALLTGGRKALRDLGARLRRWRVGWPWYLVLLIGPPAFSLTVGAVVVLLGGTWSAALPSPLYQFSWALLVTFLLFSALTDGLGEEVGWRGFALPRLLSRTSPWVASLLLGVLWGLWHLPLIWTEGKPLYGHPVWLLLIDIVAKSVLFTWVFLRTNGSLLIAVLFHATTNVFAVSPMVPTSGDLTLPLVAAALKWVLVALVLADWANTLAAKPAGRGVGTPRIRRGRAVAHPAAPRPGEDGS